MRFVLCFPWFGALRFGCKFRPIRGCSNLSGLPDFSTEFLSATTRQRIWFNSGTRVQSAAVTGGAGMQGQFAFSSHLSKAACYTAVRAPTASGPDWYHPTLGPTYDTSTLELSMPGSGGQVILRRSKYQCHRLTFWAQETLVCKPFVLIHNCN